MDTIKGESRKVQTMKKLHTLGLATGLLLAASVAFASSTFNGQAGNVTLPTAEVTPYGILVVTLDSQRNANSEFSGGNSDVMGVRYGIAKDVEVGFGYYEFCYIIDHGDYGSIGTSGEDANTSSFSAKYQTPIRALGFDWSASALYGVTSKYDTFPDDINTTQIAWVGDQKIKVGDSTLTTTVGVNWTEQDRGAAGKPHAIRYFAGVSVPVIFNLTAVGDYQTASNNLDENPMCGMALCYQVNDNLMFKAGISNADPAGGVFVTDHANFFLGGSMKFKVR